MCRSYLCHRSVGLLALPHPADSVSPHICGGFYFSHVSRHVTVTRLQVLCTELRAARARGGGNGGAFVSAMALLALAAAASAADASGLACR